MDETQAQDRFNGFHQLTLYRPMFLSYRNQSVDLCCKSTDWFLYDRNIGR